MSRKIFQKQCYSYIYLCNACLRPVASTEHLISQGLATTPSTLPFVVRARAESEALIDTQWFKQRLEEMNVLKHSAKKLAREWYSETDESFIRFAWQKCWTLLPTKYTALSHKVCLMHHVLYRLFESRVHLSASFQLDSLLKEQRLQDNIIEEINQERWEHTVGLEQAGGAFHSFILHITQAETVFFRLRLSQIRNACLMCIPCERSCQYIHFWCNLARNGREILVLKDCASNFHDTMSSTNQNVQVLAATCELQVKIILSCTITIIPQGDFQSGYNNCPHQCPYKIADYLCPEI